MKVLDSDSTAIKSEGALGKGYMLHVTSGDSSKVVIYNLYYTAGKPGTVAYVTSETYAVDDDAMEISDIPGDETIETFLSNVTPAPQATMELLDADGNPVESGDLTEDHTLKVTSGDGSKEVEYAISLNPVGIEPGPSLTEINIYPNPVKDNLTVEGIEDNSQVVIRNVFGNTVKMVDGKNVNNGRISVEELPSGIYFIYTRTEDSKSNVVRVVKE
jgi:hypothetical protein